MVSLRISFLGLAQQPLGDVVVIFQQMLHMRFFLRWIPQKNTLDDKSILVRVMAWCRQMTCLYPRQCWWSSIAPQDFNESKATLSYLCHSRAVYKTGIFQCTFHVTLNIHVAREYLYDINDSFVGNRHTRFRDRESYRAERDVVVAIFIG